MNLTRYEGPGAITFAAKIPGHIMPVDIAPGQAYFVHRHGWLCGTPGITPSVGLQQSFRGGLYGGDGHHNTGPCYHPGAPARGGLSLKITDQFVGAYRRCRFPRSRVLFVAAEVRRWPRRTAGPAGTPPGPAGRPGPPEPRPAQGRPPRSSSVHG